ncbi:cell wall-binding repeat-containing protein [Desulfosporosinus sp. SYSU MS00001]|uniref:cell wall-binding repeat-containing protein n=1 Tax=Desulfosporosinus sp. SYSU MS00001 TaxID=3416284 RepID=UPI003CF1EF98
MPFNAFADGTVPTRLAGNTAAQTAVQIADQTGWTGTAILASSASYGMVDALTAGPLAASLKAPILLTGPGNTLDADTKAELTKLNVTKVYVTSGTAVISQAVLDQLSGMGITVVPLGGVDRAATSVNIAKQMTGVTKVAVANGLQDALSIASIASAANEPILLTDKNALPASVSAYLAANPSITSADVIGGTGIISDAVKAALPSATRHAGTTAYDTNNQVIQDFDSSLKYTNVFVANGVTGIDALAGAPLAAKTNSPIVLTDGTVPAVASFVHNKLADSSVVTALGGTAVVSDAVRTGVITGTAPSQGALAVSSVTASAANSIKVVFNNPVADTSKIACTITRGSASAAATVTSTWSDDKTSVVLSASSNFAEGVYSVAVKNGDTDLGTTSVDITAQRVAKITFDSNKLAVITGGKTGYVSYRAFDQYGNDITDKYLASSSYITWSCGIGDITSDDKGILTIHPFGWNVNSANDKSTTVLTQYTTTVITAVTKSQTIPCSATATLDVSTQVGTISDITLNKLVKDDGSAADPQVGDSEKYYIDYSAKDMAGNDTKSKVLVENGLITNKTTDSDYALVTSNSELVKAQLVEDPADDNKCAIEVAIQDNQNYTLTQDQPITITATSYTGKTSSITFTLRRDQKVNTFTLMAPTETISSGETDVDIPFVAYDQNGNQLTKYSDITKDNVVALSPLKGGSNQYGLYFEENADGTASLKYDAPTNPGSTALQETLNATVNNTGNFCSININIDLPKKADTLKLDDSVLLSKMEENSQQKLDFGYNDGGFTVEDQYGRVIDMVSKNVIDGVTYYVKASLPTSAAGTLSFAPGQDYAYAGHEVVLNAGATPGSATVTFKLMASAQNAAINPATDTVLDTKTLSMTVLKDEDITDYVLDGASNPVYAIGDKTTPTKQQKDQYAELTLHGKTSSGSKVVLDPSKVTLGASSSSDFYTFADDNNTETRVAARALDASKTGSTTTVSATAYNDNDKRYHAVSTTVTSKTDDPVAQSMGFGVETVDRNDCVTSTGITYDGTTVTVNLNGTQSQYGTQSANAVALNIPATNVLNAIAGRDLTRFTNSTAAAVAGQHDALTAGGDNRGYIYIWAKDQYGSKAMNLSTVRLAECSNNGTGTDVAKIVDGTLVFNYMPTASDYIVVSGVSTNSMVETVKIKFEGTDPNFVTAKSSLSTSIANAQAAETGKTEGAAVGNQVVGSKATLDAAITAAQAVYNATTSTTTDFTSAKTTLDAAVTAYTNAVVADITTGLVAPTLAMSGTMTGAITGYTPASGETLNVTSATPAVLTVDNATALNVTAVSAGPSVVTVQVLDSNNHVIKTGTVTVTVGA